MVASHPYLWSTGKWVLTHHGKSQLGQKSSCPLLQFSSWAVLFSSFLLFVPHLLFWGPFLMPIITIFLSWDLSQSLYMPSNPYTVPCITARQGILFASLFLVMDTYSFSQFSRIGCILLLLIFFSMIFHDVLFLLSGTFYLVPQYSFAYSSRSLPEYISPHTCTYSLLLICIIHVSYLPCLESLAPRPNLPSPIVHLVAPELAKLLIISISLHPTLKGSLLLCLNRL